MKLIVATPSISGQIHDAHRLAVERLFRLCRKVGLAYDIITLTDPLITRARNDLAHIFLTRCWDADHLVFLDSNILFEAPDILEMVALPHDILGGVYPRQVIEWERTADATQSGVSPEAYAHPLVIDLVDGAKVEQDGTILAKGLGCGVLKVTRKALEQLAADEDTGCIPYLSNTGGTHGERVTNYFQGDVTNDERLPSDSGAFCAAANVAQIPMRAFVRSRSGNAVNFCCIAPHIYRGSVETRLGVPLT